MADADRVLEIARRSQAGEPEGSARRQGIIEAAELLGQLLQDVERKEDGDSFKEGVSRDRIVSVHDTEMRHRHKISHNRFDGYKAAVAVDTDSQLITAVDVLPGNAGDSAGALKLVEQSEDNTGVKVEETIGDCAYGDGATRQAFAETECILITKVPGRPNKSHFPKEDFDIDLESGTCTCPAGVVTRVKCRLKSHPDVQGGWQRPWGFVFDAAVCVVCALRAKCVAGKKSKARTVSLHPQEALLQKARALQHSEAFAEYRLARLVQLGIRQARYFGRAKTLFQLLMAAAVANDPGGHETCDDGQGKPTGRFLFCAFLSWFHDCHHDPCAQVVCDDYISIRMVNQEALLRRMGLSARFLVTLAKDRPWM